MNFVRFCVLCVCVVVLLYWKKIGLSAVSLSCESTCYCKGHGQRAGNLYIIFPYIHTPLSHLDIPVSGGREELDGDCPLRFESSQFRPETSLPEDKNKKRAKKKEKRGMDPSF